MENTMMDPELASEMVKLLGQELKVVRVQLREAELRASATPSTGGPSNRLTRGEAQILLAENVSLKADNAALQEMVANLQDELRHASSIKIEDDAEMMPRATKDFTRLLAENEDLIRDKEEAARNKGKLTALQEKYKRAKSKVREYDEARKMLDELRASFSSCAQELEQSRKTAVSEIDFRDFLSNVPYESVEGQLELSAILPYAARRRTRLHKDIMRVCNGPYFLNCNEVIWSSSGIALGLVIKPTFQYNPKIHSGTWTKFKDDFEIGKQMDVCHFSSKGARYLGTYERVGTQGIMVIAPETLKYLNHEKLDFVSKSTTLFPDLVPPSQTQMIINMYKQGVIKLQCFGIRCVAFNHIFAEKLQKMNTSSVQNPLDNDSPSGGDNRKRKRDARTVIYSNKNKKRYGPLASESNSTQ